MLKKSGPQVHLFDIKLFGSDKKQLLKWMADQVENSRKLSYIVTPNPEHIVQMKQDQEFKEAIQGATIRIPDGIGLVYASLIQHHLTGEPALQTRIPGREIVKEILDRSFLPEETKVMVVGGKGYDLLDDLPFVWIPGYEQVAQPTLEEEASIATEVRKLQPEVVLVALGAPYQEKWMVEHYGLMQDSGVKLAMGVGGAVDVYLNLAPPVPTWVANAGFEWLFRLVTQPWRWRRQLRLLVFIWLVLSEIVFAPRSQALEQ